MKNVTERGERRKYFRAATQDLHPSRPVKDHLGLKTAGVYSIP
jgi:hypothetical protein